MLLKYTILNNISNIIVVLLTFLTLNLSMFRFYVIIPKQEEKWNFIGEPVATSTLLILLIYMRIFKETQNVYLLLWNGTLHINYVFFQYNYV